MLALLIARLRVLLSSLASSLHDANRLHAEFATMVQRAEQAAAKIENEIKQHDSHVLAATRAAHAEVRAVYERLNSVTRVHHAHIYALDQAQQKAETLATNLKKLIGGA